MSFEEEKILFCGKCKYRAIEVVQWISSENRDCVSKLNFIIKEALKSKSFDTIKFLLANGYRVVPLNKFEQTALHLAVFYGSPDDIISALFENCDITKNHADKDGLTYFHIACITGHASVVEHFIERNVDINLKCHSNGFTALHFAVAHGRRQIVVLLLKNGADVKATDLEGKIALHLACANSKRYCQLIVSIFSENRNKNAVEDENTELQIVELLVKAKSDLNKQDHLGNTPIYNIFQNDQYEKLRSMRLQNYIYYGENYRMITNELRKKQRNKFQILLQNGADLKVHNEDGDTVLHQMITGLKVLRWPENFLDMCFDDSINAEMVELLLKQDTVDINAKNNKGETPLQQAIFVMSIDIVKILLHYNADLKGLKFDFHHPKIFPCLEVVENIMEIVNALSHKGFNLSCENHLSVLKLFTCNHFDYDYTNNKDTNSHYKLMNLLEIGSTLSIRKVFAEMWQRKLINKIELGTYLIQFECANVWTDKENMTLIKGIGRPTYRIMPQWLQDCQNEVLLMRTTMLRDKMSLYDIMTMNPNEIYMYLKNGDYKQILLSPDFKRNFNCYKDIVKGHFAKGLIRQYILESTCPYLRSVTRFGLPDYCCEKICNYLSNEDLRNFCFAAITTVNNSKTKHEPTSLHAEHYLKQLQRKLSYSK